MLGDTAHSVAHLARRATAIALGCLAFALGSGLGAYLATAQQVHAQGERPLLAAVDLEAEASATFAARGPELPELEASRRVLATPSSAPEDDVHAVARALSVQPPASPPPAATAAAEVRRTPAATPPPVAAAVPAGTLLAAQVTFYYCSGPGVGDGGGFCGRTADGTPVEIGVAACDRAYMGQQFRVVGDPSGLVFRCADTGGAVHGGVRDMWFPTAAAGGAWLAGVGYHVTVEVLN